jgi:predicted regulator of Ras-like GTPase activity (Roadblock/LC7/MglB family)
MYSLPQIIQEDVTELEGALSDLVSKTEASAALILDIGGFLVAQQGRAEGFDYTTIGALASASFAATQAMAGLVSETNFSSIYQQGENFSLILHSIDGQCLLAVIFPAQVSVGVVKYYATGTISRISDQLQRARERDPDSGVDLASLNMADPSELFRRKEAQ